MDTMCDSCNSNTSTRATSKTDQTIKKKAASAPAIPQPSDVGPLKPKLSAPSYLNSLRENDDPPFRKPEKEPVPYVMVGKIMNEVEAVAMFVAADDDKENGLRKFLGDFLIQKNVIANYCVSEKNFLISLILEIIDYAAQRDFNAYKLSVLITIYLSTHMYFKWYYWQSPTAVWKYFKEVIIRHTIMDSPDGDEVFGPEDCYDIITHFHTVYLSNLPLIHIVTFGTHSLKLLWPFNTK